MTIQEWNLVINAAMLALMACGGLWLKYVVDQQLKSKDTAIQALDGVVKLKDAQIAALEGNTAPAIAKAYADMRQHANLVTEESQKLAVQLRETTEKYKSAAETLDAIPCLALVFESIKKDIFSLAENWETLNPGCTDNLRALALLNGCRSVLQTMLQEIKCIDERVAGSQST